MHLNFHHKVTGKAGGISVLMDGGDKQYCMEVDIWIGMVYVTDEMLGPTHGSSVNYSGHAAREA